jgi:hypothetical protein
MAFSAKLLQPYSAIMKIDPLHLIQNWASWLGSSEWIMKQFIPQAIFVKS